MCVSSIQITGLSSKTCQTFEIKVHLITSALLVQYVSYMYMAL